MTNDPTPLPDREPWGWTRTHRIGIAILLTAMLIFLAVNLYRHPYRLDDSVVVIDGQRVTLEQQIDPNSADWPSLARLPHIGESLAKLLVTYRQQHIAAAPDGIVFHTLDDLEKIGGFGQKTREGLRPYLIFPDSASASATQPL